MKVVRHSVFETNSSSTHSISIASGDFVPDHLYEENGVVVVYPGEFGWEEEEYYDAQTKASYCLTHVKSYENQRDEDLLREVIESVTGKKVEFRPSSCKYNPWGYIDHQSSDVPKEAFASSEDLKDFIFNPRSVLRTDNDNH